MNLSQTRSKRFRRHLLVRGDIPIYQFLRNPPDKLSAVGAVRRSIQNDAEGFFRA
jgi:hypothetical protein